MNLFTKILPKVISCILLLGYINNALAQEFLPKLNTQNALQNDTSNFYFKEIWVQSKDVNADDAYGYTRRAYDKIQLGLLKQAIADIDKSIRLDSTIAYNYSLKGFCKMKEDSNLLALDYFKKAKALNDTDASNYIYLGDIYMKLKRFQEADSCYNICTIIDPTLYNAYFGRANVAFTLGRFEDAEKLYKKVLDLKPDFAMAYYNMALMYLYYDSDKTLRYLNKTIETDPSFAHAYYLRGYLQTFKYETLGPTLKDWNKAIELDSTNTLYRLSIGFMYLHENKYNQGIDEINRVINSSNNKNYTSDFEKNPDNQRTNDFFTQLITFNQYAASLTSNEREQIKKALGLFFRKDFLMVDDVYKKLINKTASKGLIYYLMGFNQEYLVNFVNPLMITAAFSKIEKPIIALNNYQNALQQTNCPLETYLRQGYVFSKIKEYRKAISSLNIYISSVDNIQFAYRYRGIAYMRLNLLDSALMDFDRFIKLDSTDTDIYFNRANCYKLMCNYPEAILNYNIVLQSNKEFDMESAVQLSECKYLLGDTLGALKLLCQTYDSIKYLSLDGYLLRGLIYSSYALYDSAINDFNQYIRNYNRNSNVHMHLGKAYYYKHGYANAIACFNFALYLNNKDINSLYYRALSYVKTNKPDLAYADFKLAESLGHPMAGKAIQHFLKDFKPNETKTEQSQ